MQITDETVEVLEQIDALLKLARANFPGNSNIRIETCGVSPRASIIIRWHTLQELCQVAAAAIRARGDD